MKRFLLCALALTALGCTPEQLDYIGITDEATRAVLLALDDTPMQIDGGTVNLDGTFTAHQCETVPSAYRLFDPSPAMQAFRAVTCRRGWSTADTNAWSRFAEGVMRRESGFCPNLLRGDRPDWDCNIYKHSRHSDAGFGQVIWKYAPYLGPNEGLWSKWDIIATPENSMVAFVALIEHSGRQPWCFSAKLRRGAICRSAP